MPPPKKPKMGRTSLEQFLSDEERYNPGASSRDSRDSEGNSPAATIEDGSDGEVFMSSSDADKTPTETFPSCNTDARAELFHKLLLKSRALSEEHRETLKSPPLDEPSPTTSPSGDGEKVGAFRKYQDHIRLQIEKRRQLEVKLECRSPDTEKDAPMEPLYEQDMSYKTSAALQDMSYKTSAAPQQRLTTEQGRLIDTLVASALATSAAQSIIYGGGMNGTANRGHSNGYAHGQNLSFSTCTMKNYENEPHDLSKRSDVTNGHLFGQRFYDRSNDHGRLAHVYREWALRQNKENALERSKQYLDSHRRIADLLSVRTGENEREEKQSDKENVVTAVPARYPNALYSTIGINGILSNYRYDTHQREGLDRVNGKMEENPCMMSPAAGYMPSHSMMPPGQPVAQSPTSTTMDNMDRFHPALLSPHFLADSRRMKLESSPGGGVNKLCQVCSDNASGFHYGVWSCEGCKAFFKRSIQGPVDYVCPATNTCTIDKHRRKSCQACRLRKCYEVGMNKGSQRKERKSTLAGQNKSPKRSRSDSGENPLGQGSVDSAPTPAKNSRKSRTSLILEALGKAEMPRLESFHNHNLPPTKAHLLTSFVNLAEKELVNLINWAKNVPGYSELSLGDQVHLIECCWMELLFLNIVFRSLEHGGRRLVIAPDLVLERPYWSIMGMSEVFEQLVAVSEQLVQYSLHKEEHLLLQATILANAEVRKLSSYSKLYEIRQNILDGIVDIAQKYHPDNLRHVPSLLLLLTHIRQASERAVVYFQSIKRDGVVTFCALLSEMLDAQSDEKNNKHQNCA